MGGEREKWNGANYLTKGASKSFFHGGEKGGGERAEGKLPRVTLGLRREQHAHSTGCENLSYATGKWGRRGQEG